MKDKSMETVGCWWVFTIKNQDKVNEKYKVRLVALGYMDRSPFSQEVIYALVAKINTIKILLAIANHNDLNIFKSILWKWILESVWAPAVQSVLECLGEVRRIQWWMALQFVAAY